MILFENPDYDKFFNPLCCKNKKIYYECILQLIEKSKQVTLLYENDARDTLTLYFRNLSYAVEEIPAEAGYFHATYRQEHPVQKGRTYTIVDGIEGRGQFVGVTLATGMNGNNTCWVEGEARMYLDDDPYPSIHYTGTEDYFGGSYGFGNDIIIKSYQTLPSAPLMPLPTDAEMCMR